MTVSQGASTVCRWLREIGEDVSGDVPDRQDADLSAIVLAAIVDV